MSPAMQLIKQRGDFDCGIAVMAMLLGLPYEEAERLLGRDVAEPNSGIEGGKPTGVWPEEVVAIAWRKGIPATVIRTAEFYRDYAGHIWNGQRQDFAFLWSAQLIRKVLPGRRACMVVPSLNVEGHAHWIAWDGTAVFDPSPKRTYSDLADVVIAESVVLP